MKKFSNLNAHQRKYLSQMKYETMELRCDVRRRFRNALLCLAQCDPRWMIWVEKNFKKKNQVIGMRELMLIEARARALTMRGYGYFGRNYIGGLLFSPHWAFTDNGNLGPG